MIVHADILKWVETYDGDPFHAALMDCPYEMEFMGKGWDNSGVSFRVETWAAIAKHLHPGAFLFVFAGTINDDLISVAMRQAGLRKYHKAMAWGFGSGFPKAARIDTVIDRRAGVNREVVGKHPSPGSTRNRLAMGNGWQPFPDVTAPATDMARDWAGHRYGGQLIKPAVETILVFQKPYDGPPVESMVRTGAGALWIDGARIDTGERWSRNNKLGQNGAFNASGGAVESGAGRWPANLALCHLPSCNGTCAPGCPVAALGVQSGERAAGSAVQGTEPSRPAENVYNGGYNRMPHTARDDTGTAARFFYNADWQYERLEQADPVGYFAKASKSEREAGLDDMQVRLLREWYGDDVEAFEDAVDGMAVYGDYAGTSEHGSNMGSRRFDTATINDGRAKSIDNPYQRGETKRKNIHPTVKPIALSRWLATLLLPPAHYAPRRLLVPFAGVASEYIGAMLAGWEQIEGVELEESHVKIARARIAYWEQLKYKLMNPDAPIKVTSARQAPEGQLELF